MLTRRKNMRLESGNNQSKWTPGMPKALRVFIASHDGLICLVLDSTLMLMGTFMKCNRYFCVILHMPRVATLRSVYL